MPSEATDARRKVCYVTTGATAPFEDLIKAVLRPDAIGALQDQGYSHLIVQYGTAKHIFEDAANAARQDIKSKTTKQPIAIDGYDFKTHGIIDDFVLARDSDGLVLSHAGTGTLLAALRYDVPLIMVPNTKLLDNHQQELATAMHSANYCLQATVDNLALVLQHAHNFKERKTQYPPPTAGRMRETQGLDAIMDAELGFQD